MLAKKFGIGFGIAIVLPLLVHYGVSTFVPQVKWDEYYVKDNYKLYDQTTSIEEKERIRQEQQLLDTERKAHTKRFETALFLVSVPIGIAAILMGAFCGIQAIGAGLIFGGIFSVTNGYCWYWSELQDWMRFLSLLVAFIVLIGVGYMKSKEKVNKS